MKALLFLLLFSAQLFAADKITIVPTPKYLGGGSKVVVKDSSGKTVATGKTVERPVYLGGGSITTITPVDGKKTTVIETQKPKFLGGGSEVKKK
jgi:ABC-type Fe3+-hydroxamate transport system substrate-binding protein